MFPFVSGHILPFSSGVTTTMLTFVFPFNSGFPFSSGHVLPFTSGFTMTVLIFVYFVINHLFHRGWFSSCVIRMIDQINECGANLQLHVMLRSQNVTKGFSKELLMLKILTWLCSCEDRTPK